MISTVIISTTIVSSVILFGGVDKTSAVVPCLFGERTWITVADRCNGNRARCASEETQS